MKTLIRFLAAAGTLLLGACASTAPAPVPMAVAPSAAPSDGAIYRAGGDIVLFQDRKARLVGDVLTVQLVERTDAKKSANTTTAKSTDIDIASPTIAGRPVTVGGTPVGAFGFNSAQGFTGSGGSTQSNALSGSLSAVVTQVLPNGNMVIRGEKYLALNQGSERVSVEGIVRPEDIGADNVVASTRIANAQIRYGGRGVMNDANAQGWLARFFNSPFFPF